MNETPTVTMDETAFRRVWQRVMPQDRPDCPFTLEDPPLTPPPQPLVRGGEGLRTLPPQPLLSQAVPPQSVPCLGEASLGELPALEERIDAAALCRKAYRAMKGGGREATGGLSAVKTLQLRRLRAAHFLISGQDYVPAPEGKGGAAGGGKPRPVGAQWLRQRFRAEQTEAAALMEAARAAADPCLSQLYRELAEEDRDLADRVRALLERKMG